LAAAAVATLKKNRVAMARAVCEGDAIVVSEHRAMELLGVSRETLTKLGIPHINIGAMKHRLYRVETLRLWAANAERQSAEQPTDAEASR
jgi:predicted short-subunit dehydrogenase-like oxidoreductase (DUF2520 family)